MASIHNGSMDKMAERVSAQERKVEDLRRELERAEIELKVWREAAKIGRPAAKGHVSSPAVKPARRGKAKGTISAGWRQILGKMVEAGNRPVNYEAMHALAKAAGVDVEIHSIRERARTYSKEGHLERGVGGFRVTKEAIARYEL